LPKPQRDGRTALSLTPLELIARLVAQLENKLAAATAAPPPLPWRARTQCPAASGRHRLRARCGPGPDSPTACGGYAATQHPPLPRHQAAAPRRATPGHCSSPAYSSRCPWSARTAVPISASSPSSPRPPRCGGFSWP
jgi:hypothetical protein